MKKLLCILLCVTTLAQAQISTTSTSEENRWLLSSTINLPAARVHLLNNRAKSDPVGHLELFSAFGVGMSCNFGKTIFVKDLDTDKILFNQTEFHNIIGFQIALLYSSKIDDQAISNINDFSIYSGINLLDIQLGGGYALGAKYKDSNGWFLSISYGIPIHKISKNSSFFFKRMNRKKSNDQFSKQEDKRIIAMF